MLLGLGDLSFQLLQPAGHGPLDRVELAAQLAQLVREGAGQLGYAQLQALVARFQLVDAPRVDGRRRVAEQRSDAGGEVVRVGWRSRSGERAMLDRRQPGLEAGVLGLGVSQPPVQLGELRGHRVEALVSLGRGGGTSPWAERSDGTGNGGGPSCRSLLAASRLTVPPRGGAVW